VGPRWQVGKSSPCSRVGHTQGRATAAAWELVVGLGRGWGWGVGGRGYGESYGYQGPLWGPSATGGCRAPGVLLEQAVTAFLKANVRG